jgi:hypothetical protein
MRFRAATILVVLAIAAAAVLAAVTAGPASATPSMNSTCTMCHTGAASGAVTATPSTSTPAGGAAYTVAISIGLTASGRTGYHVATTDAGGSATNWIAVSGGPGSQTSWTANMTAPAAAGTYYYKVWSAKGKDDSTGQAKYATYSITVPPPSASTAVLSGLSPTSGPVGTTVIITGAGLGTSGAVAVGGITAATSAWSATSITCTVPAGLTVGAKNVVVTPAGGAASNALAFSVDALPASDSTAPTTTVAAGPVAGAWCNDVVTVTLAAADSGGSGVAVIVYRVDGAAPVTVNASSVDVAVGAPQTASAVGGPRAVDGPHTVDYYATDVAGNKESMQSLTVNIDTCGPATRAPRPAKAKQGRTVALKYEIRDTTPNAGTAEVAITVRNGRGKIVKRLQVGPRAVNTSLTAAFRCTLRPGTYRFSVRATDAAGNPQANIASQRLTVR